LGRRNVVEKVLWVVNYPDLDAFLATAIEIGAARVAIRTDNDVSKAIKPCHDRSIQVFGWRWPYADATHAKAEAARVNTLFQAGLDGYYVDPEGAPGEPWDWDMPGLAQVAKAFCTQIVNSSSGRPIGVTSHYRAADVYPHLPWREFVSASTVLLPQAYWRADGGKIGSGLPDVNYDVALAAWKKIDTANAVIEPMAGELAHITSQELKTYAKAAQSHNVETLHFYDWTTGIPHEIWQTIKDL
jgi:hypothetical protein